LREKVFQSNRFKERKLTSVSKFRIEMRLYAIDCGDDCGRPRLMDVLGDEAVVKGAPNGGPTAEGTFGSLSSMAVYSILTLACQQLHTQFYERGDTEIPHTIKCRYLLSNGEIYIMMLQVFVKI